MQARVSGMPLKQADDDRALHAHGWTLPVAEEAPRPRGQWSGVPLTREAKRSASSGRGPSARPARQELPRDRREKTGGGGSRQSSPSASCLLHTAPNRPPRRRRARGNGGEEACIGRSREGDRGAGGSPVRGVSVLRRDDAVDDARAARRRTRRTRSRAGGCSRGRDPRVVSPTRTRASRISTFLSRSLAVVSHADLVPDALHDRRARARRGRVVLGTLLRPRVEARAPRGSYANPSEFR